MGVGESYIDMIIETIDKEVEEYLLFSASEASQITEIGLKTIKEKSIKKINEELIKIYHHIRGNAKEGMRHGYHYWSSPPPLDQDEVSIVIDLLRKQNYKVDDKNKIQYLRIEW